MSRNWLIGLGVGLLATAALVTVGVGAYQLGEDNADQVVVDRSETLEGTGRIIVEHDGWRHGGPGFLVLPLLIAGVVVLLASRRHHGWCGPGYGRGYGPGPGYGYGHGDEPGRGYRERDPWSGRDRDPVPGDVRPPAPPTDEAGPPPRP